MPLRNLSNGAMIALGDQFNKDEQKALIKKDETLPGYMGRIARDTQALRALNRSEGEAQTKIDALTGQTSELDTSADHGIGCFDDGCKLALEVCKDATLKQGIAVAHKKAMSAGRAALVLGSYAGMGGEASKVEEALEDEDWEALKAAKIADTDLAAILTQWIADAKALTAADQQRATLQVKVDGSRVSDGAIASARNQWIRTMSAFIGLVRSSDLSVAEQDELLAAVTKAEQDADAALAARRSAE